MKSSKKRRRIVYFVVCLVLLLFYAATDVAGTERYEFFMRTAAVKINPDDIEAHKFLTGWYIERGDYKKAAREIEAILRLSPDLDLMSAIDTWCKLPEAARSVIQSQVSLSLEKPNS